MQIKNISDFSPELIVWEDISACDQTWASEADLHTWLSDSSDAHVEQVGFVVAEDERNLIICDSYIESMGLFGNTNKIPKSVIISRTSLVSPVTSTIAPGSIISSGSYLHQPTY